MSLVISYVSDLHLEIYPKTAHDRINELANHIKGVDVLVVAGDFASTPCRGVEGDAAFINRVGALCEAVSPTEVVYVPGNHEYYSASFPHVDAMLKDLSYMCDNLTVLNNDVTTIKEQRFVGTTLWFPHREYDVDLRLNDFNQIENFSHLVEIRGKVATNFLVQNLQEGDVVVTHHLPSHRCVDPVNQGSTMNRFYVNNVEPLIEDRKPALWIHGHSHTSLDMVIGDTRVVRNPYGYEMYETNPNFDFGAYVEV